MSGAAHDLLDRGPVLGHSENGGVGLFSAEVTFILDTLGSGEQAGIDRCGADRGTDLPHGLANGIEKGTTGVLHEMPTVGDLCGIRQRPGRSQRIATAAISRDNGDLWLTGEPRLRCSRLAVWQQCDRLASFKVANDRSVALVSPPRPVVDPHDRRRGEERATAPSDDTKKRVVTHGEHQPLGETRSRAAA
jgi:hypothetical protein